MRLEFGAKHPPVVRVERIGDGPPWKLLFLSDLHLTARKSAVVDGILEVLTGVHADAVLLGGDLVDRRDGLDLIQALVEGLDRSGPVYAVHGNHDRWVGLDAVGGAISRGGGAWLPAEGLLWKDPGRGALELLSRLSPRPLPAEQPSFDGRPGRVARVLVSHTPYHFPEAVRQGIDLHLAGHLHGGQCVLWRHRGREWPGALWSRWNGPRFERGSTTLLVGRGLSDTLPFRWNCPREILSCRIGARTQGGSQGVPITASAPPPRLR